MARKAPRAQAPSEYDVHPSVAMVQTWIASLREKSGRSLEEWLELVKTEGPADEKERRGWLKSEHGLGTNTAWWLAERAEGRGEDDDPEKYLAAAAGHVEAMYAGGKAGLKPLHDEILRRARRLGSAVKVCPCKTIVPLYRNHVFAEIKPATRTRLDLGFALKDTLAIGRLLDLGDRARGNRITHRIPITRLDEIDDEVDRWLRTAYERDA